MNMHCNSNLKLKQLRYSCAQPYYDYKACLFLVHIIYNDILQCLWHIHLISWLAAVPIVVVLMLVCDLQINDCCNPSLYSVIPCDRLYVFGDGYVTVDKDVCWHGFPLFFFTRACSLSILLASNLVRCNSFHFWVVLFMIKVYLQKIC